MKLTAALKKAQEKTTKAAKAAKAAKATKEAKKKPAGNVSLKELTAGWQTSIEDVRKAQAEDEEFARDKGKGVKFAKMKPQLPPHIIHLYDEEAKLKASPRAFRTMLINKLFNKEDDGKFTMNLKDAMFEEGRSLYEKKYGKDQNKAMPKSIMLGLYFQHSNSHFQAATMKAIQL